MINNRQLELQPAHLSPIPRLRVTYRAYVRAIPTARRHRAHHAATMPTNQRSNTQKVRFYIRIVSDAFVVIFSGG